MYTLLQYWNNLIEPSVWFLDTTINPALDLQSCHTWYNGLCRRCICQSWCRRWGSNTLPNHTQNLNRVWRRWRRKCSSTQGCRFCHCSRFDHSNPENDPEGRLTQHHQCRFVPGCIAFECRGSRRGCSPKVWRSASWKNNNHCSPR